MIKQRRFVQKLLEFTFIQLLLVGCVLQDALPTTAIIDTPTPTNSSTLTPNPCTGWWCTVTGVVYDGTAYFGNELDGVNITLFHASNCSPTSGEFQSTTNIDGKFEFRDVFFHDTDRIQIRVKSDGDDSLQWDSMEYDCHYCSCFASSIEIVLSTTSSP